MSMAKQPSTKITERISAEIEVSRKLNEKILKDKFVEWYERYCGKYNLNKKYSGDFELMMNEVYPIIQWLAPSIFFQNPQVFAKPRSKTFTYTKTNPKTAEKTEVVEPSQNSARTQEALLNWSIYDMRYSSEVRKELMDALIFNFGVLWHGYKGEFGITEDDNVFIKSEKVFVKRTSPYRFIFDPATTLLELESGRWVGRVEPALKNEVLEDKKYTVSAKDIKKEKTFKAVGCGVIGNAELLDNKDLKGLKLDDYINLIEVYYRCTPSEVDQYKVKGWVMVFCDGIDKPIRVNEWEIINDTYPAKILQFNELNDSRYPMGDIDIYSAIADHKNIIINVQLANAMQNSKNIVGISKSGADEDTVDDILSGENNIVLFEDDGDVRTRIVSVGQGGASTGELYMLDSKIQANLDDKSGVSDIRRGVLKSGEESATSVRIRTAGGSIKIADRQAKMAAHMKESLEYILSLIKQFMPYKDAVRIVGSSDIAWSDDFSEESIQAPVDVEIDVQSMVEDNPSIEVDQFNQALALITNIMTNPMLGQKIGIEGKKFNISPLIEQLLHRYKIKTPAVFEEIPEGDSAGFASIQQIREAQENVMAILSGEEAPHPPSEQDDHTAKIEIYILVKTLFEGLGQELPALDALLAAHQELIQEAKS